MIGSIVQVVSAKADKEGFSGVAVDNKEGWKIRFWSTTRLEIGEQVEIRDFWTKLSEDNFVELEFWDVKKSAKCALAKDTTKAVDSPTVIEFQGPFVVKPGTCQADIPPRLGQLAGVYLWTVEFDKGYLVNYVGKTVRFSSRFSQYDKWMDDGKTIIDPDYMPLGENWLLDSPTADQILRCAATYRFFLGPIEAADDVLLRIESALIHGFRGAGGKTASFLGNKRKPVFPKEGIEISIRSSSLIHALGSTITI